MVERGEDWGSEGADRWGKREGRREGEGLPSCTTVLQPFIVLLIACLRACVDRVQPYPCRGWEASGCDCHTHRHTAHRHTGTQRHTLAADTQTHRHTLAQEHMHIDSTH
eukprot:1493196-Rhodomonas_salina.2